VNKKPKKIKKLIIVLDGLGDRPNAALRGKTPLEAARPRALNALARRGRTGLAVVAGRVAPESDVGVFAVLGYNPLGHFVARGALEALGAGLRFQNGWLALRANFATVASDGKTIIDRRVGRSLTSAEAKALEKEINAKVKLNGADFVFRATVAHRGALVIRAPRAREALSGKISNTDPAYARVRGMGAALEKFKPEIADCVPLEKTQAAQRAAELVNEFTAKANRVLEESATNKARGAAGLLPANAVLLRDAESRATPPKKKLAEWTLIADMPLEIGIGRFLGMKVTPLPTPAAALSKKEYTLRVKKTLAALKKSAGVYVHIKGPDLFGHDGDAQGKTRCIREIDAGFIAPLAKKIDWRATRVLITADHSTPCKLKAHSADAVPVLIVGAQVKADGSREWSERECAARGSVRCASSALRKMLEK
jgi:2,3-bisphosphoglycerate-independent phosphoglycerate mutase